ncbi:cell division cycle protein [Ophiostoma piceae UAMH 11346]|uniref:Cell division cycle protein n=1 Tax=Ophiostoma piceae (strain UAMH 11346) TaxID=1262450 RepID=S3CHZ8_OPHP1|nr:cell division cycle protein [Ophiostoma piceae UAMH 11346]
MLPRSPAATAQWPPRSPGEVLASTPSGRARLQRLEASRTSPSPMRTRQVDMHDDYQEAEDDEDEETLQLQLQEIQAKLRLKKLQAARAQKSASSPALAAAAPLRSARSTTPGVTIFHNPRSPQRSTVEVPASPVHKGPDAVLEQKSPKRVLLGIDKGLRGQDVSLKRAPASFRRGLTGSASSSNLYEGARAATSLSQRETAPTPKPLSFNERLAAARTEEASRLDKVERIQKLRTSAFGVGKSEMEQYKERAVDVASVEEGPTRYSREDILGAAARRTAKPTESGGSTLLRRSNTTPDIRAKYGDEADTPTASSQETTSTPDATSFEPYSGYHLNRRILPHSVVTRSISGMTCYSLKDLLRDVKAPNFQLPEVETDVVVMAIVAEKSDPRSHKPFEGGKSKKESDRGKYMVLTLVDLEYQVELFLFKTGFERFWKITTGTVVAILNPGIMPPPPGRHDTGRWSLVINSDEDTILELGIARDLGYCKSIKRDGHQCTTWINSKRTEYCEYHTNEAVKKMRATRNDLNGAAGFGTVGEKGERGGRGGRGRGGRGGRGGGRGGYSGSGYDNYSQAQWYVAGSSGGTSASALIDNEALSGGYADKVERTEGIKRRLAARERESDIARKLSEIGSGAGRDYMKLRAETPAGDKADRNGKGKNKVPSMSASSLSSHQSTGTGALSAATAATTVSSVAEQAAASRASLLASIASRRAAGGSAPQGLNISNNTPKLGDHDSPSLRLGPAKRKRPQSALSSSAVGSVSSSSVPGSGRSGFGWGSDLRAKLGRMKDGERLVNNQTIQKGFAAQRASANTNTNTNTSTNIASSASTPNLPSVPERSPVRKKTRFLLGDKGIREAGRESLGTTGLPDLGQDDDEDELVII